MDGKCVRLIQGEYHRQIIYEDNPRKQAEEFFAAGAKWLHVVDLEGAKIGKGVNTEVIKTLASVEGLNVEVGGGIREEDAITRLLDMGVARVIIGTQALHEFEWFSEMSQKFSGKIVLGLDARGEKLATHGWTKTHSQTLLEFALEAARLPLAAIIYTDISKDGMLCGPNIERTKSLADAVEIPVIASGGIYEVADIEKLKAQGNIEAVIVGRAIYEKTIDLAEAIEAAK
jgi:phosphoribosylformimino-5-aminoimidazole carboxamide ribotide isomerase